MKKIICMILSAIMMFTVCFSDLNYVYASDRITQTTTTTVASGQAGENVYWSLYDIGTLYVFGKGAMYNYTYSNLPPWSSYADQIKAVIVKEGVTSVGDKTFGHSKCICKNLKSVTLASTVTLIGSDSFAYTALKSIELPAGLTRIGASAFYDTPITSIDFPDTLTYIGASAFNSTNITSVIIPDSVTIMGNAVFQNCFNLETAELSNNLKLIDGSLFFNCYNLKDVTLPKSLTYIGNMAFQNCNRLTFVNIPEGVTRIGVRAFAHCDSLDAVVIPKSVTTIDKDYDYPSINSIIKDSKKTCALYVYENTAGYDYAVSNNINYQVLTDEVSLNLNEKIINIGETLQLSATFLPAGATVGNTITWISSDENIASVDENGLVTSQSLGTATITATTEFGVYDTCKVHVTSPIEEVEMSETSITLYKGEQYTLTAQALPIESLYDRTLTWSSDNENIVTVDNGVLTAISEGTATIKAMAGNGVYGECEVTVKIIPIERIELSKTQVTLYVHETVKLKHTIYPTNTTEDKIVGWFSSDESIVTVSQTADNYGVVKAIAPGTTLVRAVSVNGVYGECEVTVITRPITSIVLSNSNLLLDVNESATLTYSIYPSNTTEDKTVIWASSNPSVATVENGVVRTHQLGTATITVTTPNGCVDECVVTVQHIVKQVYFNKTKLELNINETEKLNTSFYPMNATNTALTWESSDTSVATVDSHGNITAIAVGTAKISAYASTGEAATCTVVVCSPITSIQFNESSITVDKGSYTTLNYTIYPLDTTDSKTVTWHSSNTNIATVVNGILYAKARGTAEITVTTHNGYKDTMTVTVMSPVEEVVLNKTNVTVNINESFTLTAIVLPEDTTDVKTVIWSSSDNSVATVDSYGNVTTLKSGSVTITASSINGKTATCLVTILSPITHIKFEKKETTMNKGDNLALNYTIYPLDTTDSKTVTWHSSDTNVATVVNGVLYAKARGTAEITVTTHNGYKDTMVVTVMSPVEEVVLNKTNVTVNINESFTLTASVLPEDTTDVKTVIWSSSDNSVATVDSYGNVTTLKSGSVTITASSINGKTATCLVTVLSPITQITLNKTSLFLEKGESETLSYVIYPLDTTDSKSVTWTSSDENVATVDQNGKICAVGSGFAYIKATTSRGVYAQCVVNIAEKLVYTGKSLDINLNIVKNNIVLTEGSDYTIKYSDTINAGVHTATITYKDGGKETRKYVIYPYDISLSYIQVNDVNYATGTPLKLVNRIDAPLDGGEYELQEGKDYQVYYYNNTSPGTATIVVVGQGNFTGSKTISATIEKKTYSYHYGDFYVNAYSSDLMYVKLNQTVKVVVEETTNRKYESVKVSYNNTVVTNNARNITFNKPGEWTVVAYGEAKTTEYQYVNGVVQQVSFWSPFTQTFKFYCISDEAVVPTEITALNPVEISYDTLQLSYKSNFANVNLSDVSWSSSDTDIATVEKGLVTILKPGSFVITASIGDQSATWELDIDALDLTFNGEITNTNIAFDKANPIVRFNSYFLQEGKDYTYEIETIANTYLKVKVKGKGLFKGEFARYYYLNTGNPYLGESDKVTLSSHNIELNTGSTYTLSVQYVTATNENNIISWYSSNEDVATVDANGMITALKEGNTVIKAVIDTGVYDECQVIVHYTGSDFASGNGTQSNPYVIKTKEHLNNVRKYMNKYFVLGNDIVFDDSDFSENGMFYNDGYGWLPIGLNETNSVFTGVIDGNGYVISNLQFTKFNQNISEQGFFLSNKGEIKNLGFVDLSVNISNVGENFSFGTVCGYNSGTIKNCFVTGKIDMESNNELNIGGIVSTNMGNIDNCYNAATIYNSSDYDYARVGGIACFNGTLGEYTISNCFNKGRLYAFTNTDICYVGGIAAENNGIIKNCLNNGGDISAFCSGGKSAIVGGICGLNGSLGIVDSTANKSYISAKLANLRPYSDETTTYTGGIVGYNCNKVTNAYNTGTVKGESASKSYPAISGGIVGYNVATVQHTANRGYVYSSGNCGSAAAGIVSYNVLGGNISDSWQQYGSSSAVSYNTATSSAKVISSYDLMKKQSTYANFDFKNTWIMDTGSSPYPVLRNQGLQELNYTIDVKANISLKIDTTYKLTVSFNNTPYSCYVSYSSSNNNVVTIDKNGNMKAVGLGTAEITVTTVDGKTAICNVTVHDGFPFTDVKTSKWYYNVVKQAYEAGLMSGTSETTFSPDNNMTRGMLVTVLHRIAGKPSVPYTGRFKDVSSKTYCATAVEWAAKYKVVNGNSDGTFKPNDNITRQDVAVILYNYARSLGLDVTGTSLDKFADKSSVSSYARDAMKWAVSVGIMSGSTKDGKTYLNPKANATRAECAKMLLVASKIYK